MGLFNFLRKSKAPEWRDLTNEQKLRVTSRIAKGVKAQYGARYKLVSGTDVWQHERGMTEHKGEDDILSAHGRGVMLD